VNYRDSARGVKVFYVYFFSELETGELARRWATYPTSPAPRTAISSSARCACWRARWKIVRARCSARF